MSFLLRALRMGRKNRADTAPVSPPSPPLPSSLSYPSMLAKRNPLLPWEMENPEKKGWDTLESWSLLLETGIAAEGGAAAGEEWMADLSQLFIGNKFASGSHSRIYRGIYKQHAVAVKMVKIPDQDEETRALLEKQFKSEVSLLSGLYHPNIVLVGIMAMGVESNCYSFVLHMYLCVIPSDADHLEFKAHFLPYPSYRLHQTNFFEFIAACKKPPVYCIITEYMSQGTLRMYLHKKEPYSLSTETILKLALDISRGMQYLHSQGIVHGDLKSNNLLLNDEMSVKVADFGTSCMETKTHTSKGNMGTYRWMAPEMIKKKPYTRKVDVYSFGIVLWELTTALVPFQGMTPVQAAYAACEKNLRPLLSATCSPVLNNLIKHCWSENPVKRPDFNHVVAVLEKCDECLKDGLPLFSYEKLRSRISLASFQGCVPTCSFIPVRA